MNTPDTEVEDYRIFTSRICEIAEEHPAGWKLMIENAVKNRDSSRDTYWKERVQDVVNLLKECEPFLSDHSGVGISTLAYIPPAEAMRRAAERMEYEAQLKERVRKAIADYH